MANEAQNTIQLARAADALVFAKLLHAFNVEFGASTPSAETIAERAAPLLENGELTVLFAGEGPDGFAQLRFRPSIYTGALDTYLEELYPLAQATDHCPVAVRQCFPGCRVSGDRPTLAQDRIRVGLDPGRVHLAAHLSDLPAGAAESVATATNECRMMRALALARTIA
jgi:hypothetical protein